MQRSQPATYRTARTVTAVHHRRATPVAGAAPLTSPPWPPMVPASSRGSRCLSAGSRGHSAPRHAAVVRPLDSPVLLDNVARPGNAADLIAVRPARADRIPGAAGEVEVNVRLPARTVEHHRAIGPLDVFQAPAGRALVKAKAHPARLACTALVPVGQRRPSLGLRVPGTWRWSRTGGRCRTGSGPTSTAGSRGCPRFPWVHCARRALVRAAQVAGVCASPDSPGLPPETGTGLCCANSAVRSDADMIKSAVNGS